MSQPIEFFFDFSSPYAYLAAQRIDGIAARHDRAVLWRPILLGAIFKETGGRPLKELGQKWIYAKHELARTARLHGVPFVLPEPFPFAAVTASRAFYAIAEDDPARARDFAKAVFRGTFASALDMGQASHVASVAQSVGVDAPALMAAIAESRWKDRLRTETEQALARGVFGAPFVFVDGEAFWGAERLGEVDQWLTTGGW